jgi:hypothetical protein
MESLGDDSEQASRPQTVLEQMLGRHLTAEEEHMPMNFHKTVSDIDPYIEWAGQYDFIKVIEPRTRYMGGWEAAVMFPEGQTITFWEERWPEGPIGPDETQGL